MDLKMGPEEVYKSPNIKEIHYDIVVAIFATHTEFTQGFRGVHIGKRTWATYISPPWLIAFLVSPDEPLGRLEAPIRQVIKQAHLSANPSPTEWNAIYKSLEIKLQKTPVEDLLTSRRVIEFLQILIDHNIGFIDPKFNFEIGPFYPLADRLMRTNSYDTRIFLEKLTLAEIFTCEPVGGVIFCPTCHGFKVVTSLACPNCHSSAFRAIPAQHSSQNLLIVSKTLNDTHPVNYNCLCCNHTSKQPTTKYVCTECGSTFLATESEFRPLIRLVLNTQKAQAFVTHLQQKTAIM